MLKIEALKTRFKHEKPKPNYALYGALKRDIERRNPGPESYTRQAKIAARIAGI